MISNTARNIENFAYVHACIIKLKQGDACSNVCWRVQATRLKDETEQAKTLKG